MESDAAASEGLFGLCVASLLVIRKMTLRDYHGATQTFSVQFDFEEYPGLSNIEDELNELDARAYEIRNMLCKCVYHSIMKLAENQYCLEEAKTAPAKIVNEMRSSACLCQRSSIEYWREQFIPCTESDYIIEKYGPDRMRIEGARYLRCYIKFQDGPVKVDAKIYFRVEQLPPRSKN